MNRPLPRISGAHTAHAFQTRSPAALQPAARSVSLMRKYEASALLPDLSISHATHIAPATPLFEEASCAFARGTLIETVRGPVAIEDLLPGDYLQTDRSPEPILWIGSTSYVPGKSDNATTLHGLTRITADAFGMGRPASDILAGPAARMVLRRDRLKALIGKTSVLVPVADYADGEGILDITPAGAVQLYHLMLGRHALIRVGGIEMESYHPGKTLVQTQGQNTRALFLSMFPNLDDVHAFGELAWTRTRRDVVESLMDS